MTSPTQRTLAWLRTDLQAQAQVVERWNPHARIRQDLFGCIDIVAVTTVVIGVQACAASSHSARVKKSMAEPKLLPWLRAGAMFWVVSWGKKGKRGEPKRWTKRVTAIYSRLDDSLCAAEVEDA
jgi:hypothetical protein